MCLKMLRFAPLLCPLLLLLLLDSSTSYTASGPHIADVNILLPPRMTHPVEYRLQGSDGCFKWSWDHHDILSVQPEYNSSVRCSTSARLRSIAPYSGRKETAVYAIDVNTGIVIRCKVFIDNFSRIQIFHNSIKLDLDGLATLRVRAFDSEENVFSSLVGLQFMWHLMPEIDGLPHHLVHVPLKDSPLSDCGGLCGDLDIQIKLEDSGVFSDSFVVKGVEIGQEIVAVHLLERGMKHMADRITLTVAEAMSLDPPSPVFVLIGATIQYSLKVIRENSPQVIKLPSPHHRWSVSNSSVAQVDSMMGLTNALGLGVTAVVVEDTRVAGHKQVSSLNVVIPDALRLYIAPFSTSGDPLGAEVIPPMVRWYVVSGRQYLIQMKVFSQGPGAQEIYITKSDDVKLYDNQSEYWRTSMVSDDIAVKHGWGIYRILKATSQGLGKLMASLTYFSGHHQEKEVLQVVQEVMVCDKVKFSLDQRNGIAQNILLPWAPAVYQEVQLKATGGCAKTSSGYKWLSSDAATVLVSASGVVQAKKPGKAIVKVLSVYDVLNYDEVVIEVSIPSSMVMIHSFPVETVVESHLQAAVTMKAPNGSYFYRCDAFSSFIKWKAGHESFIMVNATGEKPFLGMLENFGHVTSLSGPPCSWIYVYASGPGRTMLHATLSTDFHHADNTLHGSIVLKASLRIAAYPPLIACPAGDGSQFGGYWFDLAQAEASNQLKNLDKFYIVPGTNLDIVLLGGPEKWEGVDFIESVETLDEGHDHVQNGDLVHLISGKDRSVYRVSSETQGNFKLIFKRGNLVGDDHPLPAIAEVLSLLSSSHPSSIALIADEPVNERGVIRTAVQADRNPERIQATPITVANGRTIRIAAVGVSSSGEAFANSSSLCLRWELSSCDGLAHWDDTSDSDTSKCSWERFLVLQNEPGLCIVRATVVGFLGSVTDRYSAQLPERSENVLTDAIRLQLVSTISIKPEFSLVFCNPDAKLNLSIIGGSCFLEAAVNDSRVVEVVPTPPGLKCLQLMLSPKALGNALVTVHDIGLSPPISASAVVQVADIDWIKIISPEEISLMEGSSQTMNVIAGINDGSAFDPSQYAYMNIRVHIEDPIVELIDVDDTPSDHDRYVKMNAANFKILGAHLGITTLYVSASQQSGDEILSEPIKIEVYAPPRIHPSDIFLAPGASYVITVEGGPTIALNVEYASMDDGIATIQRGSGRLTANSPGNTTVLATFFGEGNIVICQAYGSVKIGIPSGMILNVQSEQLAVGHDMPIYPVFAEGDLFSFYELCKNYQWTAEDEKVLGFHMLEDLHGEKYKSSLASSEKVQFSSYLDEQELGFIKVLYGRSAGRTNVNVTFSCDFISPDSNFESRSYSASVSLLVVPDLPLSVGVPITWVLPPHYTTTNLLPSYSESHGIWDGQSRKGTIAYSLLRHCGEKEALQKDSISIHGARIKTTDSNDLACIQAKDRTTGRTEIATCVRVAEVAQIRITNKEFPFHVISLAVGADLELAPSYYDALGNPFYEAYHAIIFSAEINYQDIVSIDKSHYEDGHIHLKAIRHGRALVRVSMSGSPLKSDYMLISVGAYIQPQTPVLHKGGYLNFSLEGLNDEVSGQWFTGNASVISVDMQSGIAEAVGEGSTQVIFKGSNLELQTMVTVLTGIIISVGAPKTTLTNVPFPTKGYNFSVKFSDVHDKKFGATGSRDEVSYDCIVDPSFVGYAKPWMDLDMGNSFCLFFPYSPEHLVYSIPKSKDMRPYISVSINASLREASYVSGSASALFVGGFSVLEMGKNLMQLNLTPDSNKTTITILGNTDVEIYWQKQDLMTISPIYREESGIGGHAQYEIKVLKDKRFKDKIIITLPANEQRVDIDVEYDPKEQEASGTTINKTVWASVVGCFSLLVLTAAIFMCFLERPTRPQPSPAVATPGTPTPATPDRRSSAVLNEQSPQTPKPFVDYVRRTIDETPYYRRQGRRFNVQNTL